MVLGGGGTPNPATELILQAIFLLVAIAWLWLAKGDEAVPDDKLLLALLATVILVPLIQLVPLPPAIWTSLPGREEELAALSLVGVEDSWRAISLSPSRTVASLLATIPPLFCAYAVAVLTPPERRLVLLAILVMTLATALLGTVQLTTGGTGVSLYSGHHVGWVTGFQANRNATADVLLIGLLALGALAAPYLAGRRERLTLGLSIRAFAALSAGLALLIIITVAMTGSRTGTLLVIPAVAIVAAVYLLESNQGEAFRIKPFLLLAVGAGVIVASLGLFFLSQEAALGRLVDRFSELQDTRANIWADSWVALQKYWPVGFGMGGFMPAMLPQERLEFLDATFPNRAHNDFLEIGIEAGLLGYLLLALAVALTLGLAWRTWRSSPAARPCVAFGLGVLFLLALHSVVDYPLRSMAISCLAGVAAGMLVRNSSSGANVARGARGKRMKGQA